MDFNEKTTKHVKKLALVIGGIATTTALVNVALPVVVPTQSTVFAETTVNIKSKKVDVSVDLINSTATAMAEIVTESGINLEAMFDSTLYQFTEKANGDGTSTYTLHVADKKIARPEKGLGLSISDENEEKVDINWNEGTKTLFNLSKINKPYINKSTGEALTDADIDAIEANVMKWLEQSGYTSAKNNIQIDINRNNQSISISMDTPTPEWNLYAKFSMSYRLTDFVNYGDITNARFTITNRSINGKFEAQNDNGASRYQYGTEVVDMQKIDANATGPRASYQPKLATDFRKEYEPIITDTKVTLTHVDDNGIALNKVIDLSDGDKNLVPLHVVVYEALKTTPLKTIDRNFDFTTLFTDEEKVAIEANIKEFIDNAKLTNVKRYEAYANRARIAFEPVVLSDGTVIEYIYIFKTEDLVTKEAPKEESTQESKEENTPETTNEDNGDKKESATKAPAKPKKDAQLPKTGSQSTVIATVLGAMLVAVAAVVAKFNKNKM